MSALLADLTARLGPHGVLADGDSDPRYFTDAFGHKGVAPLVVLRPADTAEVAAILAACQAAGQPIIVQGGLTGLTDAALPQDGEWALSLERMKAVSPADRTAQTITVEAGATLQSVQAEAEAADLLYGIDIGARGSCTIGGMVAVNAGGNKVLRYGMTRANVLGLEAVLADGTIVSSMGGLLKDNTGFDLPNLMIGAEGVLGVVTRAQLRLHRKPAGRSAAFCACTDMNAATALLQHVRGTLGPILDSFEAMWSDFYDFVLDADPRLSAPLPRGAGLYVLIEVAGDEPADDETRLADTIADAMETGLVTDAVLARSLADIARFWRIREGMYDASPKLEPYTGFDVSVPLATMEDFLHVYRASVAARWPRSRGVVFGHLGDGNLHLLVGTGDDHAASADALAKVVYGAVQAAGGSISAEHGIGMLKKPYLGFRRSPGEIAAMRRMKAALDPANILNRGRIF